MVCMNSFLLLKCGLVAYLCAALCACTRHVERVPVYDSSADCTKPDRPTGCADGSCDASVSRDSSNNPEYDSSVDYAEAGQPANCADGSCDASVLNDSLSCYSDTDCDRFGSAYCFDGTCNSMGLDCAKKAEIDGAEDAPNGGTVAAAFDEWRAVAYGIVAFHCDYLGRCADPPQHDYMCHEAGLSAADDTCRRATIEFFAEHRQELEACAEPRELPCGLDFFEECPVLAARGFEELCE
jgi:hypothetical protein